MQDFLAIVGQLHDIVLDGWTERCETDAFVTGSDESDTQLTLGYVQAFRRLRAIKLVAEDEHPSTEAVMVLVRSLVSVAHRSLYLVDSDDPAERSERLVRFMLLSYREEKKRLAATIKDRPHERVALDTVNTHIAQMEHALTLVGKSIENPIFPQDETLAHRLQLKAHYADAYRAGSGDMHHTLFSALGGYASLTQPNPPVALLSFDLHDLRMALLRTIVVYADFVTRAEKVVKLGINEKVLALEPSIRAAIAEANSEVP